MTRLAGDGIAGFSGDGGPAVLARLDRPQSISLAADGALWIADAGNHRIRRIGPDGRIETRGGTGVPDFELRNAGQLSTTGFAWPAAVGVEPSGAWWVADTEGQRIFRALSDGRTSTLIGTGQEAATDASVPDGSLQFPRAIACDSSGCLVSEMGAGRVGSWSTDGSLVPVVDGLRSPWGLARDVDGALLVAEYGAGAVVRATPLGAEVACQLPVTMSGDDPDLAGMLLPSASAAGPDGSLYLTLPDAGQVLRQAPSGAVTTLLAAPDVSRPVDLLVDPGGRLVICDEGLNIVIAENLPFPAPIPGDLDGDRRVTVRDAVLALRMAVDLTPFHRRTYLAAKMTHSPAPRVPLGTRRISVGDAIEILRLALSPAAGIAP